jgi:hypothetical protein
VGNLPTSYLGCSQLPSELIVRSTTKISHLVDLTTDISNTSMQRAEPCQGPHSTHTEPDVDMCHPRDMMAAKLEHYITIISLYN